MALDKSKKIFVTGAVAAVLTTTVFLNWQKDFKKNIASLVSSQQSVQTDLNTSTQENVKENIIKAVYVTGWSASSVNYLDYLNNLFEKTEINAVVIDIKDSSGYVFYNANVEEVQKYKLYNYSIKNIDEVIKFFHDRNIYVIARISVFEDPMFSKNRKDLAVYNTTKTTDTLKPILWEDHKGLTWMDPSSKEVWDYNIALAKDAVLHGFDEINFDYIRFPSDGDFSNMGFPVWDKKTTRREVMKSFFAYLREKMGNEKISADIFGLTTVSKDDLGVGQFLEDAIEYFDYVCPMVYPSHYADGFIGFENPAEYPYQVVRYSVGTAYYRRKIYLLEKIINQNKKENSDTVTNINIDNNLIGKIRPWLQDFNLGAIYAADMVKSEIDASKEFLKDDYVGFMLWNPSNYYTMQAIKK